MSQIHIRDSEEPAKSTQEREGLIQADQVLQLYSQTQWGFLGALLSACVLVVALWQVVSQTKLLGWLSCYLCIQVVRYLLVASFHRASPSVQETASWGRWFAWSTIASGLVWGSAGVFLFPVHSISHQFLLALFLAGISSAAAVVYSPTVLCFLPTVLAELLPISALYLYRGDELSIIIGSVILVFAGVLSLTGRHMHRTNADSLRLRHERSELIQSLEKARTDLEFRVEERTSELVRINQKLEGEIERRNEAEEDSRQSEQKYRRIVDMANEGIWSMDENYLTIFVNRHMTGMLGYDKSEMIGRPVDWFMFEEDLTDHNTKMRDRQKGVSSRYERRFRHKDGSAVWTIVSATPLIDEDGHFKGSFAMFTDVTERKQLEETLRESEQKYRLFVETAHEAVFVAQDGVLKFANRRCMELAGYPESELLAQPFIDLIHPDDREMVIQHHQRRLRGDEAPYTYSFRIMDKEGEIKWLSTNSVLITWEGCPAALCFATDITDRKRAEEALSASEERYRTLFDNAPVGIFQTYSPGRTRFVNPHMAKMVGAESPEAAVAHFTQLPLQLYADPHRREDFIRILGEEGEVADFEYEAVRIDGSHRWFSMNARVGEALGDGQFLIEGFTFDVTERKQTNQALREKELQYRLLADNTLDVIWQMDLDLRFTYVNPAISRMTGHTPGEWIGTKLSEHCDEENFAKMAAVASEEISKGRAGSGAIFEAVMLKKNKEPISAEIHGRVIFGENGLPIALQGVTRDITERKRVEQALRESEAKYRTLIEASPDGVFIQVGDRIEFANSALARMVGAESPEALEGTHALDLVHPDYYKTISQRMIHNVEQGETAPLMEQKLVRQDGSVFDAEAVGAPISWRGKRARQVLVRDITDRKTMQKQLLEAQKMEAVGILAGGVAHDFNNLLHIISGHAELLEMELSERELKFGELDAIRQSAHRGADLVRQILTFSRRIDSTFESININEVVNNTERLLYRTIPKMIEIDIRLEEDLSRVRADSTQIEQMLINLAVNAKDAMPDGGKLTIETRSVLLDEDFCRSHAELVPGRYVLLKVSDTGHGMEKDVRQHIFEPFFTTKGLSDGTGLGLATAFGIVKMHGGHIACESEVGKGTTFSIYFPAIKASEPDVVIEQEDASIPGGTETILVVDDEPMIRELAKRILQKSGYSILTAGSGKEGIEVYVQHKSDISLVILDLIMPEMGGKQCLEELLKINPQVKTLIASGFAVKGDTKTFLDTEAKGIVPKPFNMRDLLRSVRHVLDGT